MSHWALDLGTTNTALARWDERDGRPRLVELPTICRQPTGPDELCAPGLVPSATHLLDEPGLLTRLGTAPFLARRVFWGRRALIGRPAWEANQSRVHPNFAESFKPWLGRASYRTLAHAAGRPWSAREVARAYLRELLAEARRVTGERIRRLVVTAPVESYEAYRAELRKILGDLGVTPRFVDEPVAAAAGYNLGLARSRRVMLVDFGGGSLDVAVVELTPESRERGRCRVLGKAGRALGGDHVDQWFLEALSQRLEFRMSDPGRDASGAFWYRLALAEARAAKEALHFREREMVSLTLPDDMRAPRSRGAERFLEVTRDDLVALLTHHGLYDIVDGCVDEALGDEEAEEVLLVGGSTLLPEIYPRFEERFGRANVRAWQPFEAVAQGACALSAGDYRHQDLVVHDYALLTHDRETGSREYVTVVPRGTRIPTEPAFWRRQMVPTCAMGVPENSVRLVVCEIGAALRDERRFAWDDLGRVHRLDGNGAAPRLVVPLNEKAPVLGRLSPPHPPTEKDPRLDVSFMVDADRWLRVTVRDLWTNRWLMRGVSVVRLM